MFNVISRKNLMTKNYFLNFQLNNNYLCNSDIFKKYLYEFKVFEIWDNWDVTKYLFDSKVIQSKVTIFFLYK